MWEELQPNHISSSTSEATRVRNPLIAHAVRKASATAPPSSYIRGSTLERSQCQECGKHFWDSSAIIWHQRVHIGEKPYECQECGKTFRHRSSLVTHMQKHTRDSPIRALCVCRRGFSQSSVVTTHHWILGGKALPCVMVASCPVPSGASSVAGGAATTLAKHQSLHTEEQPYICVECEDSFPLELSSQRAPEDSLWRETRQR